MTTTPSEEPKKHRIGAIFGSEIVTFNPENVLEQMIESQEGTVFVLGTREVWDESMSEGERDVEITFAQIKKVRSR